MDFEMHLDEALRQIAEIRQQMARSEIFRGYRSLTVGFSGIAGLAAALLQPRLIPAPELELGNYLVLWLTVAAVSVIVAGMEIYGRVRQTSSVLAKEHSLLAAEQFLPAIVVGGIMTLSIYSGAPHAGWMLPGLWSLVFGLGIFASSRLLPRPVFWVGAYYVLCGCFCLMQGQGEHAFSPWQMGVSFGGGQLLGAAVLYWTLEKTHDSTQNC